MSSPSEEVLASVLDTHPSEAAYKRLLPEILAVPEDALMRINVDVVSLVTSMVGALPEIQSMREAIADKFRDFDFERFDKFGDYVLALNHANALYRSSHTVQRSAAEQVAAVQRHRELLLASANVLGQFGLLDIRSLATMRGVRSHRELAGDTLTLVALLKAQWEVVEGKIPLSLRELNAAASDAFDLQRALGLKEQAPALRHDAKVRRRQAYSLFRQAYDPIRRAALWLYGEEGASEVVPKLTPGRTSGSSEEQELEDEFDPADDGESTTRRLSERVPIGTALQVDNPHNLPLTPVTEETG